MILLNLFCGTALASLKDIWYANPGTDFDTEEVAGNWIDKNSHYILSVISGLYMHIQTTKLK